MHYLMALSERTDMVFRTELLMRSINHFSPKPAHFSVVINGEDRGPWDKTKIVSPSELRNRYIAKHADVYRCPYHWSGHPPCRWFVEPKHETSVMIDVDVVACSDLSPVYQLDPEAIHGVTAYTNHLDGEQWQKVGGLKNINNYFNFGVVFVPSKYLRTIGEEIFRAIPEVSELIGPHNQFFAAQISLARTLDQSGVRLNALTNNFNRFDILPPDDLGGVLFLHYFVNKDHVCRHADVRNPTQNEYTKLIGSVASKVFSKEELESPVSKILLPNKPTLL